MTALFNLQSAHVHYGKIHALADCTLQIEAGEHSEIRLIAKQNC